MEETADCVFRLIEDEYEIRDRALYEQCKAEVRANKNRINENYKVICWESACDDPYDGWHYSFHYGDEDESGDVEFDDEDFDDSDFSVEGYYFDEDEEEDEKESEEDTDGLLKEDLDDYVAHFYDE